MLSNNRLTIASMGLNPYLDGTAHLHNSLDSAWFDDAMKRLETGEITKKDIYDAMGISPITLDKYILIRSIERVQHGKESVKQ